MRYFKNIITTLKLFGEATGCIENIIIFGSRVTGMNEFDSDIDNAIQISETGTEESIISVWVHESEQWEKDLQNHIPYKVNLAHYRPEFDTPLMQNIKKHGISAYTPAPP